MKNLLLEDIRYKVEETSFGTWRRFVYVDGQLFEEFIAHGRVLGLPLVHYTRGRCPETGKRIIATGVVAIGRIAVGVVAIGHAAVGIIAVGQLALGLVLGLGQAATGLLAVGQFALAVGCGLGQFVTGYVAIGQFGLGRYVLAQIGLGEYVWDMRTASPIARQFFQSLRP